MLRACEGEEKSASFGKVSVSSHVRRGRPMPRPRWAYCGAWLWVSIRPGMRKECGGRGWSVMSLSSVRVLLVRGSAVGGAWEEEERADLIEDRAAAGSMSRRRWVIVPEGETRMAPEGIISREVGEREWIMGPWKARSAILSEGLGLVRQMLLCRWCVVAWLLVRWCLRRDEDKEDVGQRGVKSFHMAHAQHPTSDKTDWADMHAVNICVSLSQLNEAGMPPSSPLTHKHNKADPPSPPPCS